MSQHVMLDLETLGTSADAVILSVGAVVFDSDLSDVSEEDGFYAVLSMGQQLRKGRTVDPNTFRWWMRQSKDARHSIADDKVKRWGVKQALDKLQELIPEKPAGVWGNGSDFDNAMLQHLAAQYGYTLWPFWKNRCFRTFTNLYDPQKHLRPVENPHHALLDCHNQVLWMHNICMEHGVEI